MTYDQFQEAVGLAAADLPDELFNGLTGGVITLPQVKLHEKSVPGDPLYVAGEYVRSSMGRQVKLYYGSFMRLYRFCDDETIKGHIRRVLLHELKHHWEGLSGERTLEYEDEERISQYLDSHAVQTVTYLG